MRIKQNFDKSNGQTPNNQLPETFIPPEIRQHLGDPPLVCGEKREDYDSLFTQLVLNIVPGDIIEWIWAKDVLDLVWEAKRLRTLKAAIIRTETYSSSEKIFGEVFGGFRTNYFEAKETARELAIGWTEKDTKKTRERKSQLAEAGYDINTVTSDALIRNLPAIACIEKMIASCDKRRDDILREIERSRENLAKRIKEQAQQLIEDIEVEPTPSLWTETS